jgi:hydrogenase/urease accessory protein HupE
MASPKRSSALPPTANRSLRPREQRRLARALALLALGLALFCARSAWAHDPFEITTDAHVHARELDVHTTLSLLTAERACLTLPGPPRHAELADFTAFHSQLEACARNYYRITEGGEALALRGFSMELTLEGDVDTRLIYERPSKTPLVFEALGLQKLAPRAGVVITVTGERTFLGQKLLRPDDSRFELPITAEAEAPGTAPLPSFGRFLELGVAHILTGTDHLLFLFGLLVVCRRMKTVAIVVTCFTLAHSVTLALAALNVLTLPSRVVEPLIAATIVLVGVENLYRGQEPAGPWPTRWCAAFGFGLIHGLGFASALQALGLGAHGTSLLGPLVAFNLGVELGQLSIAALLLAALWSVRKTGKLPRLATFASLAVTALGLFWFVQRIRA